MPKNDPTVKIKRFRGMNNTEKPSAMGPDESSAIWLTDSQNVDVDNLANISLRPGYATSSGFGNVTGAFSTADESQLYVISDGNLCRVPSIGVLQVLESSVSTDEVYWCEMGEKVVVSNQSLKRIIGNTAMPLGVETPDLPVLTAIAGSLPPGRYLAACLYKDSYGREGGCSGLSEITLSSEGGIQFTLPTLASHDCVLYVSHVNGNQLYWLTETDQPGYTWTNGITSTQPLDPNQIGTYPPPETCDVVAWFQSKLWLSEFHGNTSFIYPSLPFFPHLFKLDDYITVDGQVRGMAVSGSDQGQVLIIGTSRGIYAYTGDQLITLSDSAALVPGNAIRKDGNTVYMWTDKGVCTALPFQTIDDYSAAPGSRAAVGVREYDGRKMLVILTDTSGNANNPRN